MNLHANAISLIPHDTPSLSPIIGILVPASPKSKYLSTHTNHPSTNNGDARMMHRIHHMLVPQRRQYTPHGGLADLAPDRLLVDSHRGHDLCEGLEVLDPGALFARQSFHTYTKNTRRRRKEGREGTGGERRT